MGRSHDCRVPDRAATLAGIVGVLIGAAHLAGGLVSRNLAELPSRAGIALAFIAGGVAFGWVGRRVANVMSRVNDLSAQMSANASDDSAQMREVLDRLGGLALGLQQLQQQHQQPSPISANGKPSLAPAPPADDLAMVDPMIEPLLDPLPEAVQPAPRQAIVSEPGVPAAAAAAHAQVTGVDPALLDRIMSELEDLREISLMTNEQRQLRLSQHLEAKRRLVLGRVFICFRTGQWAAADEMLTELEVQYSNEAPVKQARSEFFRLRTVAEPDALFHTEQRVRELVHVNAWDRAIALASEFVNNFPSNEDGRHLLSEVQREHTAALDIEFQRRYEQVQSSIHRRLWRAALADAEHLLDEFPEHPRSGRLRNQLRTLRENAEIEERQEQEMRLQLMLEQRRFGEAVQAAEEIVRRFPASPQAEALVERLPQLRQLAAEEAEPDLV